MNTTVRKSLYTAVVVALSLAITFILIASRKAPQRRGNLDLRPAVSTMKVVNNNIRITVPVLGRLVPQKQVNIFAEVSGVLESSANPFLEGATYKKGEPILVIQSDEARLNVTAQRSNLLLQLTQLLADLKFEYPESHAAWETYLQNYQIDQELQPLPQPVNEREKMFVAAKGIYQTYYSIKSQETRLGKYIIRAPFDGTVTTSNIKPGNLVMNGQNLGQFISTDSYDLETQVAVADVDFIKVGDRVELSSGDNDDNITGTVTRISQSLDQQSQMVNVYVTVQNQRLKAGQYLSGQIYSGTTIRAAVLPRKMITNKTSVFLIENGIVREQPVTLVSTRSDKAIITGLEDGLKISTKTQNIYTGMKVKSDKGTTPGRQKQS